MVKKIILLMVMFFLSVSIVIAACPDIQNECIADFKDNPTIETFSLITNPTLAQFNQLSDIDKSTWIRESSDFSNVRHLGLANDYFVESGNNINQNRDKFKEFVKKSTNSLDILEFTGNVNSYSKDGVLSGKSGSININDFKGKTGSILGISIVNGEIQIVRKESKRSLSFTGDLRGGRAGTFSLPHGSINGKKVAGVTLIRLGSDGSVEGKLEGYDGVVFDKPTTFKTKLHKDGSEIIVLDNAGIKSTQEGTKTRVKGSASLKGPFKDMEGTLEIVKGFIAKIGDVEIEAEENDVEVVIKEKNTDANTESAYQRGKRKISEGFAGIVEISDKLVVAGEGLTVTTTAEGLIEQEKKATGEYDGYLKLPSKGNYKKGDKSEQVKVIQNLVGVDSSGVYDSATTEAVKRWQEQTYETTGVCGGKLSGNKCSGDGIFGKNSRAAYLKLNSGKVVTTVNDGAVVISNSPTGIDVRSTGKSDLSLGNKQYQVKDSLKIFHDLGGKVKSVYDQIDFGALVPQETPGIVSNDIVDVDKINLDVVKAPTKETSALSPAEEKVDSLAFWEAKKEVAESWDKAIGAAEELRQDIIEKAKEQAKTAPETVEPEVVEEEVKSWEIVAEALRSAKKDALKKDVEKPEIYSFDFKEKVGKKIDAFMDQLEALEIEEAAKQPEVQDEGPTPTKKVESGVKREEVTESWHKKVIDLMGVQAEEVAKTGNVPTPVKETGADFWDYIRGGVSEFIGDVPVVDNVEAYEDPDYSYGDVLSEDDLVDYQDVVTEPAVENYVQIVDLPDVPELVENGLTDTVEEDNSFFGFTLDDTSDSHRDLIVVDNPDFDQTVISDISEPVIDQPDDIVSGGCDSINQECYSDSTFIPNQMSIPIIVTLESSDGEDVAKLEQNPPQKEKPLKIVKMGKIIYPLREGEAYIVAAGQTAFTEAVAPNPDIPELKDLSPDVRKQVVGAGHMAVMYVDKGGEVRVSEADWSGVTDKPLKESHLYKVRGSINGIYGFKNADSEKIIQGSKLDAEKNIGWFFRPVDPSGAGLWNGLMGKDYDSYRSCVSHVCSLGSYGGVNLNEDLTYLPPRSGSLPQLQKYVESYGFPSSGNGLSSSKSIATMLKVGIETQVGKTPELATPSQVIYGGLTNGLIEEIKPITKKEATNLVAQEKCPPNQIC